MKEQVYKDPRPAEHFTRFHERVRRGRPDWMYEFVRLVLTPYLLLFYRARCIDSDKVPADGPAIIAPNHFSFLDHFFVAVYLRRKVHFMAKSQLFTRPIQIVYTHGGVFPVRRGQRDEEAFKTADAILKRGGLIVMYVEGGRSRSGELGDGEAGHREAGARVRRADRAHGDRRHRAGAQLEAPPVPEGHRAVRRPDPLRAGRVAHARAVAGGVRDRVRGRARAALAAAHRGSPQRGQGRARGAPGRRGGGAPPPVTR